MHRDVWNHCERLFRVLFSLLSDFECDLSATNSQRVNRKLMAPWRLSFRTRFAKNVLNDTQLSSPNNHMHSSAIIPSIAPPELGGIWTSAQNRLGKKVASTERDKSSPCTPAFTFLRDQLSPEYVGKTPFFSVNGTSMSVRVRESEKKELREGLKKADRVSEEDRYKAWEMRKSRSTTISLEGSK